MTSACKEAPSRAAMAEDASTIAIVKRYNSETQKWEVVQRVPRPQNRLRPHAVSDRGKQCIESIVMNHRFPNGGLVRIYPSLLSAQLQKDLTDELDLAPEFFRQYPIQGGFEPRAHYLLHSDATLESEQPQPGYRYGTACMKARPLSLLPRLEKFSKDLAETCNCQWRIGINVVCYRDGSDSIGFHADNDQGESVIMAVLVQSDVRRIIIRPKVEYEPLGDNMRKQSGGVRPKKSPTHGDEQVSLFLRAGDGYLMDGELQRNYVHGVPKDVKLTGSNHRRIVLVFRDGDQVVYDTDSGSTADLAPRDTLIDYQAGRMIEGLEETCIYSRSQLLKMKAHRSPQKGVSGNRTAGADAIIVSGCRDDDVQKDTFSQLVYVADGRSGSQPLLASAQKGLTIRVFRSSKLPGAFRANPSGSLAPTSRRYRYDGLYRIVSVLYDIKEAKDGNSAALIQAPARAIHQGRHQSTLSSTKPEDTQNTISPEESSTSDTHSPDTSHHGVPLSLCLCDDEGKREIEMAAAALAFLSATPPRPAPRQSYMELPPNISPSAPRRVYRFVMQRVEQGDGPHENQMSDQEFLDFARHKGTLAT